MAGSVLSITVYDSTNSNTTYDPFWLKPTITSSRTLLAASAMALVDKQIEKGFWHYGIDGDWKKNQTIETLSPTSKLQNLKYITLIGTKITDQSLKPLADNNTLEKVWNALLFRKSAFEYVYTNLANLKYGNLIQIITDKN